MNKLTDSHIHMDLIFLISSKRVEWLIKNNCTCISWAFGQKIKTNQDLENYLKRQHEIIQDLNTLSLKTFFLTGIHPRNMYPGLSPERIDSFLNPYLDDKHCLGIGEIGLETGSAQEKELFIAQLEYADKIGTDRVKIGIHTPRINKQQITREILNILDNFKPLKPGIVIDHLGSDTIHTVLNEGYTCGVTLAPEKTSLNDLKKMIECIPGFTDHIMCNSDSSTEFIEDFINASHDDGINHDIKEKIFHANAQEFWNPGNTHGL